MTNASKYYKIEDGKIVRTHRLKGKEKKEQLPSLEVEERLESVLSQPEYK